MAAAVVEAGREAVSMANEAGRKSRPRIFYGWAIVAVVFITSTTAGGIGSCVQSVFFEPMRTSLGMSAASVSAVTSLRTVVMALSAPVIGPFVDRRSGARVMMSLGAVGGGLALIAMPAVRSPWQLFVTLGLLYGVSQALLGAQVVTPVVIAKWFVRHRGRAMAIAVMGISMGCALMTPISRSLIDALDWRGAWVALGIFMIVALTPLTALVIRRQPEDLGLQPDGIEAPAASTGAASAAALEISYTLRQALRIPSAWLLTGAQMLVSFGTGPVLLHQVPYMQDKGFSDGLAAWVVTVFAVSSLTAKPIYGFLAERIPPRYLAMFAFAGAGAGLSILRIADSTPLLFAYAIAYGLNFGSFVLLMNILWADYFGRASLGAIRGFFAPAAMVISATGPILGGYLKDVSGSFDGAFLVYSGAWLTAVALMFLARPPRVPAAAPA